MELPDWMCEFCGLAEGAIKLLWGQAALIADDAAGLQGNPNCQQQP